MNVSDDRVFCDRNTSNFEEPQKSWLFEIYATLHLGTNISQSPSFPPRSCSSIAF